MVEAWPSARRSPQPPVIFRLRIEIDEPIPQVSATESDSEVEKEVVSQPDDKEAETATVMLDRVEEIADAADDGDAKVDRVLFDAYEGLKADKYKAEAAMEDFPKFLKAIDVPGRYNRVVAKTRRAIREWQEEQSKV